MKPARLSTAALGLLLIATPGCTSDEPPPSEAECTEILSVGTTTYFGVPVWMPIDPEAGFKEGVLSPCADGVLPHRETGMSTFTYAVEGFGTDEALISRRGPGDPLVMWIATSGEEPPFLVPAELQTLIDDNPVPTNLG